MSEIIVTDRDGGVHRVTGRIGVSLMETLREFDYGVAAICGGMCSCATCHVYIDGAWASKLPAPMSDETDMLKDLTTYRKGSSRLSCQVQLGEALDGLKVTIAPEE